MFFCKPDSCTIHRRANESKKEADDLLLFAACLPISLYGLLQAMAAYKQPLLGQHSLKICKQSRQQHREYQYDSSYPRSTSSCSG